MKLKINVSKEKILIYAIVFSALWHVFWLSAFKVVVVPKASKQVKFSNVSFLGPILAKGVLKVAFEPHELTTFEKNYLAGMEKMYSTMWKRQAVDSYPGAGLADSGIWGSEEAFTALTLAAIDTQKVEPGRDID